MPEDIQKQIEQAIETYNKYAQVYIRYTYDKILQYEMSEFLRRLPEAPKILDLGCGAGRDMEFFKEDGCDVVGIDIAEALLKAVKEKGLTAKKMDMRKLTFKKDTFDGIWCMASFADIAKEDNEKVVKQIHKVLKPNGIVFVATKEGEGEQFIKKKKYENSPRFYALYKAPELQEVFKDNGFEVLKCGVIKDGNTSWVELFAKKKA